MKFKLKPKTVIQNLISYILSYFIRQKKYKSNSDITINLIKIINSIAILRKIRQIFFGNIHRNLQKGIKIDHTFVKLKHNKLIEYST